MKPEPSQSFVSKHSEAESVVPALGRLRLKDLEFRLAQATSGELVSINKMKKKKNQTNKLKTRGRKVTRLVFSEAGNIARAYAMISFPPRDSLGW